MYAYGIKLKEHFMFTMDTLLQMILLAMFVRMG